MAEPAARIMPADAFGEHEPPSQIKKRKAKAASTSGASMEVPPIAPEPDEVETHQLDTMA
jgi:hypothetical protein